MCNVPTLFKHASDAVVSHMEKPLGSPVLLKMISGANTEIKLENKLEWRGAAVIITPEG